MTNVPSVMSDVVLEMGNGTIDGTLTASPLGLEHSTSGKRNVLLRWEDIHAADVEVGNAARERITATRLLAAGVFAIAWKKKIPDKAVLFVEMKTGDVHVFSMRKASRVQATAWLGPWRRRI